MLKKIDEIILLTMRMLNKFHIYLLENKIIKFDNPNNYKSLLPNVESDKDEEYTRALKFALGTPNINNIAITGPYGSGKSSFLRTFEKNNAQWYYLPISLATFKSEKIETSEIETSILQQFFYKVKDKKIPCSRFKKIKKTNSLKIILNTISVMLISIYLSAIHSPEKIKKIILIDIMNIPYTWKIWRLYFVFLLIGIYIYNIIKYLMKFKISNFNSNGKIVFEKEDQTSIFNKHLDEIIYFFEETSYNVVLFEDLDRFNNLEIFIKLRELNLLINNSEQINRRITFIYAIKDEMFKDKKRTKFFDYILPIIPYINYSNSYEKIKSKFENENIEENFLKDISLYIDDMRLLVNIYNEYTVYKLKIGKNLNKTKLLAMIIYKNFYPEDFSKSHFKGGLYNIFQNKSKYVENIINTYKSQIKIIQEKITLFNKEKIEDIKELRMIYFSFIITNLTFEWNRTHGILLNLDRNNAWYKISSILEDGNFDKFIKKYFSQIPDAQNKINGTYFERYKFIEDKSNGNLDKLKYELDETNKQINEIKHSSLKKIIQNFKTNTFEEELKNNISEEELKNKKFEILIYLLRHDYINEDYSLYMSYFFEGSITEADHEFLLSVKNLSPLDENHDLSINIKEIIDRLNDNDFKTDAILNLDLIRYLLNNPKIGMYKSFLLFDKISNDTDISISFIFKCLDNFNNEDNIKMIKKLKWNKFWLYTTKEFSSEKQNQYFKLIFESLETIEILELNVNNSIKEYIEKQSLLKEYNETENKKFITLIKELKIMYKYIENPNENIELFDYIYKNNHYLLNEKMINQIINTKANHLGNLQDILKISHYTTIQNSEIKEVSEYIEENIDIYIEDVFLNMTENTKESEKNIIALLDKENLSLENKIKIIEKEDTIINNILDCYNSSRVWSSLFRLNKVKPLWDNIFKFYGYYDEYEKILIDYISVDLNYKTLSKNEIKISDDEVKNKIIKKLCDFILTKNRFSDEIYLSLIKLIPYKYNSLLISDLPTTKIDLLLENNILNLTLDNLIMLKENFGDKNIILIENFKTEFLEDIEKFELDIEDNLKLIESLKFSLDEKFKIIESIEFSLFKIHEDLSIKIIDFILENPREIKFDLLKILIVKDYLRIKLLVDQIQYLTFDQIYSLFEELERPYFDLKDKSSKHLKLEDTLENKLLLGKLSEINYISSFKVEENSIRVRRKSK